VVISDAASFPSNAEAERITLPDDWSVNRPGYSGSVWYRLQFDRPPDVSAGEPLVIRRGGRRLTLVAEAVERELTPEERWDAYMAQGVREGADDCPDDIDTNKSHWTWDPDAKFDFDDK
jgi:hypothetical protein